MVTSPLIAVKVVCVFAELAEDVHDAYLSFVYATGQSVLYDSGYPVWIVPYAFYENLCSDLF